MKKIQANIQGYSGKSTSLFAMFDEENEVLLIAVEKNHEPRKKDCILISNDRREDYDVFFDETKIKDAISAYYKLKSKLAPDGESNSLTIANKAARADPSSHIEQDGIGPSGMEYRVSENASNCTIATLAICHYVFEATSINDCLEMSSLLNDYYDDESALNDLLAGGAVTI